MFARKFALYLICWTGLTVEVVSAQSEARIRIVMPSLKQVEEDLKYVVELSPAPELKKKWKTLKSNLLDAFTEGVDQTKPASLDIVFLKEEIGYEIRLPIELLGGPNNGFLSNLWGRGYKVKSIATDFYEVAEKGKKPFLSAMIRTKNMRGLQP